MKLFNVRCQLSPQLTYVVDTERHNLKGISQYRPWTAAQLSSV